MAALSLAILCAPDDAAAQLNQYCTVSVLNRTVRVNADGTWVLPNVPANTGRVKARATCVQNGVTRFGESEFFTMPRNGIVTLPRIVLGAVTPIPASLVLTPSPTLFSAIGQTSQLVATATYPDRSTRNVAAAAQGTDYTTSNSAIVSVSADGLLTAVASGTVVIQAINEGTPGMVTVTVVLSTSDTDGDGIPDDIELSRGMDPRNPVDAIADFDRDDLTNLGEYHAGTDLRDPDSDDDDLTDGREVHTILSNPLFADTDGDLIPDGVEVTTHTNPLNRNSYDLRRAVAVSTLLPASFLLTTNPVFTGDVFQQLSWIVRLIDGRTVLDLTADPRTSYVSTDLYTCNFGAVPGRIFAGLPGACQIFLSNSTLTVSVRGTITRFTPTAISALPIPGFANSVDVIGDFAYVAAGATGLQIVNVSNRAQPAIVASRALPGNANDVVVVNQRAYVAAGAAGLQIVDVSNPLAPVVVGSIATGNVAWDVVVKGTRAYVASGTAGLKVVDVSNPSTPVQLGALALSGTTKGVEVDVARNIAVVARGTAGMTVVDVQNPAAPVVVSNLAGGDVRDVAITGSHALLADFDRSLTAVDLTNPSAPVLTASTPRDTGGLLQDVTVFGTLAAGADVFFVNGVPLFDVSDAANPVPKSIVDFRLFRDDEGTGVALDSSFVYMTGAVLIENGVSSTRSSLYIGQYRSDDQIAPVVTIQSPPPNHAVLEGSTLPVTVEATDNFAVASVSVLVNGQLQSTTTTLPYQVPVPVPVGETSILLSAQAVDFAGNRGTSGDVPVIVLRDTDRPVVQLTAPVAPLVVPEGTVIRTTTIATDNVSVTRVEFLLNDVIVATRTSAPYEAFITLPIGPTTFRFSARAFDPAGNVGTAPEAVVTVTSDPPPTIRILTPATGTTVSEGSLFTVVIDASDNGAVISTELRGLINGEVVHRDTVNYPTLYVNAPIERGATQFTLIASATDNLGQVGTSTPVVLTIEEEPAPTIDFVTPVDGDTLIGGSTIRVVLNATDDVGIGAVALDGAAVRLSPPYEFDVTVPGSATFAIPLNMRGTAIDNVSKSTFVDLSLPVMPDPMTSLQGYVADANGVMVEGATVVATSRGLTAELFRVPTEMTALPDAISAPPDATKVISTPSFISRAVDPFGFDVLGQYGDPHAVIRLRGTVNVPAAGAYTFYLRAFPAGRLTINGVRVIDLSALDEANEQYGSNTVTLPAGDVPIEIIAGATLGVSNLRVDWGPEGGRMDALPLDALTPAVSPYRATTGADGSFWITDLPSIAGGYIVSATFTGIDGFELSGASPRIAPVPAGVAAVGTIELSPTVHPVAIPVSSTFILGAARGVDVDGDAFVASGPEGLTRVRVTDAEHPWAVNALPLPGEANDVRVDGSFAFVAGGSAGLHVVELNIFTMHTMQLAATLPLGGDALRLARPFGSDHVYVANGAAGLSIVDITNRTAPQLMSVAPIPGGARAVDFYDNQFGHQYAVVVGAGGLTVVEVTNRVSPMVLNTLPIDQPNAVAVKGATALVATATSLVGVDLSDPEFPRVTLEQPGATADVRMAGATLAAAAQLTPTSIRTAFVGLQNGGPPAVVNSIDFDSLIETGPSSTVNGVATDGTFVFVTGTLDASFGGGFLAIGQYNRPVDPFGNAPIIFGSNIWDGAPPLDQPNESEVDVVLGVFDDVAIASVQIFVNGQLVVTRNTASSQTWSSTLRAPIPLGADSVTVRLEIADVGGNVTTRTATLAVNPFLPSSGVSIGPWANPPGDIATDGRSVWITAPDNPQGFRVQRWAVNGDFRFSIVGPSRPSFAAVDGQENLWVANLDNNTVVEISPFGGTLRTISVPAPGRLFFDGTHLWVVSGTLTLRKINPSDGTVLGTFFTGGVNPGLMAFDGTHLWVVNHGSGTIAKMRPSDGVVISTVGTSVNVTGIAFDGTHLWIVNGGGNTVSIVRPSDSATVATLPTGTAPAGIAFDGLFMYVTNSGDNNATKFRVSDRVALGTFFTLQQPTQVVAGGGYLWIWAPGTRYVSVYQLR